MSVSELEDHMTPEERALKGFERFSGHLDTLRKGLAQAGSVWGVKPVGIKMPAGVKHEETSPFIGINGALDDMTSKLAKTRQLMAEPDEEPEVRMQRGYDKIQAKSDEAKAGWNTAYAAVRHIDDKAYFAKR